MCLFNVKHSIGHISGIVGPIDVKRQDGAPVGYWVNYVTSTFYLIPDLDLWFFKVKFQIAVSQELLSNWCETKRKQISYILADCMVLPFDHTHDLDLEVSRSKFEIALFEEWEGWLTWSEGVWVDHSWPWPWPMGNHGGWGGGCTGSEWLGWLQTSACRRHM